MVEDECGTAFSACSMAVPLQERWLEARGISWEVLRLARGGAPSNGSGGSLLPPDAVATQHRSLVVAATRVHSARISHLSALAFHGLTTQNPREVCLAIPRTVRKPETDALPLRVVRCQTEMLDEGMEWHEVEAAKVPVYSVARTLVDLFRQRNKLGIDVAIEALREAWRGKRFQLKELNRLAVRFRMTRVIRPYLESVLS